MIETQEYNIRTQFFKLPLTDFFFFLCCDVCKMSDFLPFLNKIKSFNKYLTPEEQILPLTHLSYIWEENHLQKQQASHQKISRVKTL